MSAPVLKLQSDQRLVALTRSGSGAAFAVIVERYRAPLLGYCRRLLGPDDAEDAVQQTFTNALRALRDDKRAVRLRPWLFRIAHNLAVNMLNRRGRYHEQLDEQLDGVPQPPDVLNEKERLRRLVAAIGELPDRQRAAILARELEGRSHEEIADAMRATTPVVRQLVHRARIRLRDACGLLVPASWLRWLLVADPRATGASDRLGEAVASGSAGASLLKAGAVLMSTGVIAAGGGGLVGGTDPFVPREHESSAAGRPHVLDVSEELAPGAETSTSHGHLRAGGSGSAASGGAARGPSEERRSSTEEQPGHRDDAASDGNEEGDREHQTDEGGDGKPKPQPHESSSDPSDGSDQDPGSDAGTEGVDPSESSAPLEESVSPGSSGSPESPATPGGES